LLKSGLGVLVKLDWKFASGSTERRHPARGLSIARGGKSPRFRSEAQRIGLGGSRVKALAMFTAGGKWLGSLHRNPRDISIRKHREQKLSMPQLSSTL
jgi:hypothetical protein